MIFPGAFELTVWLRTAPTLLPNAVEETNRPWRGGQQDPQVGINLPMD